LSLGDVPRHLRAEGPDEAAVTLSVINSVFSSGKRGTSRFRYNLHGRCGFDAVKNFQRPCFPRDFICIYIRSRIRERGNVRHSATATGWQVLLISPPMAGGGARTKDGQMLITRRFQDEFLPRRSCIIETVNGYRRTLICAHGARPSLPPVPPPLARGCPAFRCPKWRTILSAEHFIKIRAYLVRPRVAPTIINIL